MVGSGDVGSSAAVAGSAVGWVLVGDALAIGASELVDPVSADSETSPAGDAAVARGEGDAVGLLADGEAVAAAAGAESVGATASPHPVRG